MFNVGLKSKTYNEVIIALNSTNLKKCYMKYA